MTKKFQILGLRTSTLFKYFMSKKSDGGPVPVMIYYRSNRSD